MSSSFPGSLDSFSNPGATTKRDATGFEHHLQHSNKNEAIEALETKLGIGATTPDAIYKALMATAGGTSAWGYYFPVTLPAVAGTGSSGVLEIEVPATFGTLEIELSGGRSTQTGTTVATARLTFETSPTAGAYNGQRSYAAAAALGADENIGSDSFINIGTVPAADSEADFAAAHIIRIPGYSRTTFKKALLADGVSPLDDATSQLYRFSNAGNFESNAAIARVRLTLSAGNWTTTSQLKARLYP